MYKKLLTFSLIAASLAACGDDKPKQHTQLTCNDPTVTQNVRNLLQEALKQRARNFSQNDNRQYTDADKIIAAGSELNITLDNASLTDDANPVCSGQLNITVPYEILQAAYTNAPLIYGQQNIKGLLQRHTGEGKLAYNGNGVFSQTLRYKAEPADKNIKVDLIDDLNNTADALSVLLMPYGVKNYILINGKPTAREEALRKLNNETDTEETLPPTDDPQSILENNSASSVFEPPQTNEPAAEIITPQSNQSQQATSSVDLDQARNDNNAVERDINQLWNRMDQTIRKELQNEQRDWITQKNNSCRQAAARANDMQQAEYLQLQCSTRMTRERIQYLKGYSIP